jgi:hypothetical protein
MGFTLLGSHELAKRGEKHPYCHFALPKNTRFKLIQLFTKRFLHALG